jgi:hypothetical protein
VSTQLAPEMNEFRTGAIGLAPEGPEFAEPRQGRATVVWTAPLTWDQAITQGRGRQGTYIIYERAANGRFVPLTNGITETGDLARRISQQRGAARRQRVPDDSRRVRLGIMPRFSVSRARAVEHSVRREHDRTATGREKKEGRLTGYPKGKMRVGSRTFVEITHRGKVPPAVRQKLKRQRIRYGPGLYEIIEVPLTDRELEARLASAASQLETEEECLPQSAGNIWMHGSTRRAAAGTLWRR